MHTAKSASTCKTARTSRKRIVTVEGWNTTQRERRTRRHSAIRDGPGPLHERDSPRRRPLKVAMRASTVAVW